MKYDRPVWQIMHACADGMPDVFRYEDVRDWFDEHYPEVNEATIRAHLIGLTEGGRAKHVQFAQRAPVFRRVARGEYSPVPLAERGETPDPLPPSASKIKMSGNGAHVPAPVVAASPADGVTAPAATATTTKASKASKATAASVAKKSTRSGPKKVRVATSSGPDEARPTTRSSEHEDPEDAEVQVPDVILLGSVGDRVNVPAPAKEVFREVAFQLSRLDAELSGSEWFVLSAEHGLLAPNEWVSPDSRTLADMEPGYRVAWASWVVARLQSIIGAVDGMNVRVDAPDAFIGPLFADLQGAGAVVSSGTIGRAPASASRPSAGEGLVVAVEPAGPAREAEGEADVEGEAEADPVVVVTQPLPRVAQLDTISPMSAYLLDVGHAVPASEASCLPESPGLYAWFVDPIGARELNRCLRLPVRAGLVFVGQVGGSRWYSLADPVLNLRDHVERIQLHGRARASTFRMTLATVLRDYLGMKTSEDSQLTEWMLEHLSVSSWPSDDLAQLRECEQRVVRELDPPLNVDHLPATEYRARLTEMRSALA